MRAGSTSGPNKPSRPRIESSSTSGNATACPEMGLRPAVQSGSSPSLRISECRLSAACSNGLRGRRFPAHHEPVASRRTSPDFTSMTRIPRAGSPITTSASPSRTYPRSRTSQRTPCSSATSRASTARRRSTTSRSAASPRVATRSVIAAPPTDPDESCRSVWPSYIRRRPSSPRRSERRRRAINPVPSVPSRLA